MIWLITPLPLQVRGTELGWSLGAALRMLGEAEFECRA